MRVLVQRSKKSSVSVNNNIVGQIDSGLVLLVGFTHKDSIDDIVKIAKKVVKLRIFDDEDGVMNKSILDVGGEILSISQFSLYADPTKGNRPSYIKALNGDKAIDLYNEFNDKLGKRIKLETGIFGADMKIDFINDGPITILLEK